MAFDEDEAGITRLFVFSVSLDPTTTSDDDSYANLIEALIEFSKDDTIFRSNDFVYFNVGAPV
jgi:hypothetical protein